MSEVNEGVSDANQTDSNSGDKEKFVPKSAYEDVSRDMHKHKQRAKDAEARANQLEAELKAREEAKLQEQNNYKQLFENKNSELEQERQKAKQAHERFMKTTKLAALKEELGVNIKGEYLQFAALDKIVLTDDGQIEKESLREVANSFRKEHGQLIPSNSNTNITGHAPASGDVNEVKDLSKMSTEEKIRLYSQIKNKK
jgi:hypothetical protein